jgi:hypothetical protein
MARSSKHDMTRDATRMNKTIRIAHNFATQAIPDLDTTTHVGRKARVSTT